MRRSGPKVRAGLVAGAVFAVVLAAAVITAGNAAGTRDRSRLAGLGGERRLGPLNTNVVLRLELGLAEQRGAALDRLIATGKTVSPTRFARLFLPNHDAVSRAISALDVDGLHATWTAGSEVVSVDGTAGAVERAFGVQLDRYERADGSTYYAPTAAPRLDGPFHGVVSEVSGLDDRSRLANLGGGGSSDPSSGCGSTNGGFTPSQVMSAYNFGPLRSESLTGAGQTIVLLEIDTFQQSDLDCFASKDGQSPPQVQVVQGQWGTPQNTANSSSGVSESDLDIEIVHSIAPAARLVVYYADADTSDIAAAAQAAVNAYPKAVFSISIGGCEVENLSNGQASETSDQNVWDTALKRLAATGGSAFIASGDSGAYTCGSQIKSSATGAEVPTVSYPASDPYATAVGGTTMFLGSSGQYGSEAAWGAPFEGDGSGGGVSQLWQRPSWQTGQGTTNSYSDGNREVPDVSALGDPNTGWSVYIVGNWNVVAGTSAAAPLWAALTVLADQKLSGSGLQPVGFANLPIYAFGADPTSWPAKAFNDVNVGENLYYPATAGWDPATGWGTPNAAGFVQDLLAYERQH
jgi:kumamolisin